MVCWNGWFAKTLAELMLFSLFGYFFFALREKLRTSECERILVPMLVMVESVLGRNHVHVPGLVHDQFLVDLVNRQPTLPRIPVRVTLALPRAAEAVHASKQLFGSGSEFWVLFETTAHEYFFLKFRFDDENHFVIFSCLNMLRTQETGLVFEIFFYLLSFKIINPPRVAVLVWTEQKEDLRGLLQ